MFKNIDIMNKDFVVKILRSYIRNIGNKVPRAKKNILKSRRKYP